MYYVSNMAGRAAKQLLRKELKSRLSALSDSEKLRQSKIVSEQVRVVVGWRCLHVRDNFCRVCRGSWIICVTQSFGL